MTGQAVLALVLLVTTPAQEGTNAPAPREETWTFELDASDPLLEGHGHFEMIPFTVRSTCRLYV